MPPWLEAIIQQMFGGMSTPASGGGLSPALMTSLGLTPPTPAGGANPGFLTQLGAMLDPSNPMAGLMKLVSGASMLPFAAQGEGAINQGMNLLQNPQAFVAMVNKLAHPISKELKRTFNQIGQGSAAEAGLGQSAGAIASATDKAAAPYIQKEYDTAQNTAMQQVIAMLKNANRFGSPYANIAKMFTGGGSDLGF